MPVPRSGHDLAADVSERQVVNGAQQIAVILLNCATLVACGSALLLPGTPESSVGVIGLAMLVWWAIYRLLTRSTAPLQLSIDFGYVLAVAATVPVFGFDPQLLYTNSVPQVIAGTGVICVALAAPPKWSLPAALAITAAYAAGCAQVIGWDRVVHLPTIYYVLPTQWVATTALMLTARAVARRVDQARIANDEAALRDALTAAMRDHELEHMALVHDTAASTLHLVGEGAKISPDRIAAQAQRDLALLAHDNPGATPDADMDIVAALRAELGHVSTPVELTGVPELVLPGRPANAVVAVVRESLNNAERHARATRITVDIAPSRITVSDDGIGFDTMHTSLGHGVAESIVGRMRRAGGNASVRSTPGDGTVITLTWDRTRAPADQPLPADVDQLTERILVRFGIAIIAIAVLQLAVAVPNTAFRTPNPPVHLALGLIAVLVALGALPTVLGRGPDLAIPAIATMGLVVCAQSLLLPDDQLGSPIQWTLSATTLCVLPYLLRRPWQISVSVMVLFWLATGILNYVQHPGMAAAFNLALHTAGVFVVQLLVLAFPAWLRRAHSTAVQESRERWSQDAQRRIAEALHEDYIRRNSELVQGVFPLLQTLSTGTIDADIRWRARIESRRLRLYIYQARTTGNPLVAELRPAIEAADQRGVVVSLNTDHDLPELGASERRQLLAPVAATLATAARHARVGLVSAPDEVVASIICDSSGTDVTSHPGGPDSPRIEVTEIDDTIWVSVHHRLHDADTTDDMRVDIA
ncbi:sensor histidine kinase [Mycolicibacterium sp. 22603]|uniref:sensor histidine kinase n=1 Tax=Mycolicibacterium sp. 22603 TaxID=3453950 RepID=UPI003F870C52